MSQNRSPLSAQFVEFILCTASMPASMLPLELQAMIIANMIQIRIALMSQKDIPNIMNENLNDLLDVPIYMSQVSHDQIFDCIFAKTGHNKNTDRPLDEKVTEFYFSYLKSIQQSLRQDHDRMKNNTMPMDPDMAKRVLSYALITDDINTLASDVLTVALKIVVPDHSNLFLNALKASISATIHILKKESSEEIAAIFADKYDIRKGLIINLSNADLSFQLEIEASHLILKDVRLYNVKLNNQKGHTIYLWGKCDCTKTDFSSSKIFLGGEANFSRSNLSGTKIKFCLAGRKPAHPIFNETKMSIAIIKNNDLMSEGAVEFLQHDKKHSLVDINSFIIAILLSLNYTLSNDELIQTTQLPPKFCLKQLYFDLLRGIIGEEGNLDQPADQIWKEVISLNDKVTKKAVDELKKIPLNMRFNNFKKSFTGIFKHPGTIHIDVTPKNHFKWIEYYIKKAMVYANEPTLSITYGKGC